MIVCATGHRKIAVPEDRLIEIATDYLAETDPFRVISGMALGWDQAVARAAINLCIPLTAAVPFPQQPKLWPDHDQWNWTELIAAADRVHVVSDYYRMSALEERNRWMVDNCDRVLAFWDGSVNGGTANCIRYATKKKCPIDNVWESNNVE